MPSHFSQLALLLLVTFLIPANFRHPEIMISVGYLAASRTFHCLRIYKMSMPEASVDEDASAILAKHQVRMPWQAFVI